MCNFKVGQKVVCFSSDVLKSRRGDDILSRLISPVVGGIYTIRYMDIVPPEQVTCLLFEEIEDQEVTVRHKGELFSVVPFFEAEYFRPLVQRPTDISIFTAMLDTSKQGVPA